MFRSLKSGALMLALVCCAYLPNTADAAFLNVPVPTNAYITQNGYDWAWAFPLPGEDGIDLSYQSTQGWRIPTAAELTLAPLATDFLFAGANVPFNGTDPVSGAFFAATNSDYADAHSAGAVATPYFSNSYHHADWQDGLGQPYQPWAGMPGAFDFAEQLVIRDSVGAVPEPASIAMLAMGIAGIAGSAWRRRKRDAA